MTATFRVGDAVQLAVVERGGFVESRHAGSAVVLAPDGSVARSLGDPGAPVFPRSSLKPLQATAIVATGVALTSEQTALATASHAGTPAHLEVVRGTLASCGLTPDDLQCTADWPLDEAARDVLVRAGERKRPLFMNCSGKHAGMLAACVHSGWPTQSYRSPDHPLQRHIRDVVERLSGEKVQASGVDGCGAPIHAITLTGLARGIQRIATASAASPFALYRAAAAVHRSALENGWALDGPGRPNTLVIERLGVFAKGGAEGVMVMAAPNGTTLAVKILDGSGRAASIVALRLLADCGAVDPDAVDALVPDLGLAVLGHGEPVGWIRAAFE